MRFNWRKGNSHAWFYPKNDHGAARRLRAHGRRRRHSPQEGYTIGVSNTVQGNGWREEMICAIKAQALASGEVAKLNIAHRNTDAAGQLEDIRNLISAKVNAIVVNPSDPAGIKPALKEATKAGIVVVVVDQASPSQSAYIISEQPGGVRLSRRQVAVRADGRQGQRGLHARRRRRFGRQRSRQGLQEGAGRIPGREGRAGDLHRLAAGPGQAADPRLHRHRHRRSTASGPRASTT